MRYLAGISSKAPHKEARLLQHGFVKRSYTEKSLFYTQLQLMMGAANPRPKSIPLLPPLPLPWPQAPHPGGRMSRQFCEKIWFKSLSPWSQKLTSLLGLLWVSSSGYYHRSLRSLGGWGVKGEDLSCMILDASSRPLSRAKSLMWTLV